LVEVAARLPVSEQDYENRFQEIFMKHCRVMNYITVMETGEGRWRGERECGYSPAAN